MTKLFPDDIFPWLPFCEPVFFPNFVPPEQEFIPFFFQLLLLFFFPVYLQNLFLPCFFDVLYLSWLSKAVLTKISKCEWKQWIEKSNNNNDINITGNCTFENFKNYTTLKISERVGFKLVPIISRGKERVSNSFKEFVSVFDRFCYHRWFKAIQNQITAPSQVLVPLIDPFSM